MNRSKYKVYNGKQIKGLIKDTKNYVFLLLFIIGIIIGSLYVGKENLIKEVAKNYFQFRKYSGFSELFLKSATVNLFFIVLSIFFGFSLIGTPLIYCIIFVRGLGIGALCGFLYSEYGFSGVGYSALTILPSILISLYSLTMSCKDSSEYSVNAYMKAIKGRGHFEIGETKVFLTRQFIYIIISVFASVLDSLFGMIFSRFFSI